ncbi:MAG TPA: hypothetical protein ENN19_03040 [Chloroflexi bacterium]|nr:hypothetical protein [Chloroflexota bacterium]
MQLQAAFYKRWDRLADAVRSGQRPEADRRGEQADGWVRNFVHGLYDMARPMAPFIAEALDLPTVRAATHHRAAGLGRRGPDRRGQDIPLNRWVKTKKSAFVRVFLRPKSFRNDQVRSS